MLQPSVYILGKNRDFYCYLFNMYNQFWKFRGILHHHCRIVHMGFYGSNDIPLGCFLERYCFRTSYDCQSDTCGTPMLNHTRRFVHNSGCVSISLDFLDTKLVEDKIIMWSWCSKCQTCSPSVPMSRDTWSFSFAKFLELKFHGSLYTRRGNIVCSHNLHHDNIQYFSYNNLVASFE